MVTDLTVHRASLLAQAFWAGRQRQAAYLALLGLSSTGLAYDDAGELILVDLAACFSLTTARSTLGLTGPVLRALKAVDERAYTVLCGTIAAYFESTRLREELGRLAEPSFAQLKAVLLEAA